MKKVDQARYVLDLQRMIQGAEKIGDTSAARALRVALSNFNEIVCK